MAVSATSKVAFILPNLLPNYQVAPQTNEKSNWRKEILSTGSGSRHFEF